MSIEAMKQALEALDLVYEQADFSNGVTDSTGTMDEGKVVIGGVVGDAISALRQAIDQTEKQEGWVLREVYFSEGEPIGHREPQIEKQEPVTHAVIAGVLCDFMGWLTSRRTRLCLSDSDNGIRAADAIVDFAKMRGLRLEDAQVEDWQSMTASPKREWVGLTVRDYHEFLKLSGFDAFKAIEAKLRERNT